MKLQKILASLLVLSSLGLASCNKKDPDPKPNPDPKPVEPVEPEEPDVPEKLSEKECFDIFLETLNKENNYLGDKSLYIDYKSNMVEKILDASSKEVKGEALKAIIGDRVLENDSSNEISYYGYSSKDNELIYSNKEKGSEDIHEFKYYFDQDDKSYVYNQINKYGRVAEVSKDHIKHEGYGLEFATNNVFDYELIRYDSMGHLKTDIYNTSMLTYGVSKEDAKNVDYSFKVGEFENRFIINSKLKFDFNDIKFESHFHIEYDRDQILLLGIKDSQTIDTKVDGHPGYKDQFNYSNTYKASFKHAQEESIKLTEEQKAEFKKDIPTENVDFGGISLYLKRNGDYDFYFNPLSKSNSLGSSVNIDELTNIPNVKFNFYKKGSDTPIDISTLKYNSYTDVLYFDFEIDDGYALVFDDTGASKFITVAINEQSSYTISDISSNAVYVNDKKVNSDQLTLENQKLYYICEHTSGKK